MKIDPKKTYTATIDTSEGKIVVKLFPDKAPQHVNSFVFLAKEKFPADFAADLSKLANTYVASIIYHF